jgi:quercetin dioxygenase-like cupin family protein
MGNTKRKLIAAGVCFGCALGLVALKVARATPGVGIATTIVSGPVRMDEIRVKSESDVNGVKIKTEGASDIYVVRNTLTPGGHTGWHSHPGPSIISVVSGVATEYHDDDPVGVVHAAGTAFVDDGDHAHIVRNEGTTDLVLVAFQILPAGAPRRIDEPQP